MSRHITVCYQKRLLYWFWCISASLITLICQTDKWLVELPLAACKMCLIICVMISTVVLATHFCVIGSRSLSEVVVYIPDIYTRFSFDVALECDELRCRRHIYSDNSVYYDTFLCLHHTLYSDTTAFLIGWWFIFLRMRSNAVYFKGTPMRASKLQCLSNSVSSDIQPGCRQFVHWILRGGSSSKNTKCAYSWWPLTQAECLLPSFVVCSLQVFFASILLKDFYADVRSLGWK